MKSSIKKLSFGLLGTVILLLFVFILTEITLRIVNPSSISFLTKEKQEIFYQDSVFHHFRISELDITYDFTKEYSAAYRSDENGFMLNYHYNKNESPERTIIVVGDSYVEAAQVDEKDRMSSLLEKHCVENDINARALNWGFASYSPMIEQRLIEHFWHDEITDVILVLWPLNDITADYNFRNIEYFEPRNKAKKPPVKIYSFHFYRYFVKPLLRKFIQKTLGENLIKKFGYNTDQWEDTEAIPDLTMNGEGLFGKSVTQNDLNAIDACINNLIAIEDFVKSKGASYGVVVLPPGSYISNNQWNTGFGPSGFYASDVTKKNQFIYDELVKQIRFHDIQMIDVLDGFNKDYEINQFPLYFPKDRHLNERGHQICAQEIFNSFINQK